MREADPKPIARPRGDAPHEEAHGSVIGELAGGSRGWLASLIVHMAALIALALWTLPPLPDAARSLLLSEPVESEMEELEDFEQLLEQPLEMETEPVELQAPTDQLAEEISLSPFDEMEAAPSFTELSDLGMTAAPTPVPTDAMGFDGTGTSGRGRMSATAIAQLGGTQESEQAVARALEWIAEHQNADGSWSLVHVGGACRGRCPNPAVIPGERDDFTASLRAGTGLALLPFLGAGQTHKEGRYQREVGAGLQALAALAKPESQGASWRDPGIAGPYSHAIAAIALTEAYGMTRDPALAGPAQAAVDYILFTQDPQSGGWRYEPRQSPGDTSVTGWQVMALKSAHLAQLSVPAQSAQLASKFLDSVSSDGGARYKYLPNEPGGETDTRSSIGLLSRMYLGWKKENEALARGVKQISEAGPSADNYYYNYYAAQVLFQFTGGRGLMWRDWNREMREQLIATQETRGHMRGSWFVPEQHNTRGGRLYTTALGAMTLEVYYRYMPIYQETAVSVEFPQ